MIVCPTCGEKAEHLVYEEDSNTFPTKPAIKVCHAYDGVYIHVRGNSFWLIVTFKYC